MTVELLSLAHERNVEAELADVMQSQLDAGTLPTLDDMRDRFSPNPASVPQVNVDLVKLVDYDQLIRTRAEVVA